MTDEERTGEEMVWKADETESGGEGTGGLGELIRREGKNLGLL